MPRWAFETRKPDGEIVKYDEIDETEGASEWSDAFVEAFYEGLDLSPDAKTDVLLPVGGTLTIRRLD